MRRRSSARSGAPVTSPLQRLLLPVSLVTLAVVLAAMTWYATLLPHWLTQAGARSLDVDGDGNMDSEAYYAQGLGLWLNYTEHVGDATFDPGNSLWIPPQPSGVHTYASQCQAQRAFCADAIGELHVQYCELMNVYCGVAMTLLQVLTSLLSGSALATAVAAVALVRISRRTVLDNWLMNICIANGLGLLLVAVIWYFAVYRVVLASTFYGDQLARCSANENNRSCWRLGTCLYLVVIAAVLYPFLSILVASEVGAKFRRFQQLLRQHMESSTMVHVPPPSHVDVTSENLQQASGGEVAKAPQTKREPLGHKPPSTLSMASSSSTGISLQNSSSRTLAPLQRLPSSVSAVQTDDDLEAGQAVVPGTKKEPNVPSNSV